MGRTSVLILGGGLSGLAAGITLRERSGGTIDVTLLEREARVGGRAGNVSAGHDEMEHGLHFFFDYPNFRALLDELDPHARDRLKEARTGAYFYFGGGEAPVHVRPRKLPAPLHLLAGWPLYRDLNLDPLGAARVALAACLFRPERLTPRERRRLDGMAFDDYVKSLSVNRLLHSYSLFSDAPVASLAPRATFSDGAGAQPSAYAMLRQLRLVQQRYESQVSSYTDGTVHDVLVEPLRQAFLARGGAIATGHEVTSLVGDPHRGVTEIAVAERTERKRAKSRDRSPDAAPLLAAAGGNLTASHYIAALSPGLLFPLLPHAVQEMPYFALLEQLTNKPRTLATTIACELHYDEVVTRPYHDAMMLFATNDPGPSNQTVGTPYSTAIDRAGIWSKGPHGSVIQLVGSTGTGWNLAWDGCTPDEMRQKAIDEAVALVQRAYPAAKGKRPRHAKARIGRAPAAAVDGPAARADYVRAFAGSDRLRPTVSTPLRNLWLAGDYTAHSFGCIGMEGAVVSGIEAANSILRQHHLVPRTVRPMAEPGGFIPAIRGFLKTTGLLSPVVGYDEPF